MPTRLTLAFFAWMQADKPYRAALSRRMPKLILLAFFGKHVGILRAGNEPKRERTRGDGSSVLLTVCRWVNHRLDLLDRRSERPHRMRRHPETGHHYVVLGRLASYCPMSLERDGHGLAVVAEVAYAVGTNDRAAKSADVQNGANVAGNCLGAVRQVCTKSIGHCGLPRLFNAASPIASPAIVGNGNKVVVPATVQGRRFGEWHTDSGRSFGGLP